MLLKVVPTPRKIIGFLHLNTVLVKIIGKLGFLCPVSDLFVNRGKKFHCSKTVLVYDMSSHSMDYRWLIASPREYC